MKDDFIANSRRVKSRNITFASPLAASNLGDGVLNRLNVDRDGFDLENVHIELKRADCIRDEHTGADEHEEVFEILGQELQIDEIEVSHSGVNREIRGFSARDSLVSNPSFSQRAGTDAVPSAITDWTVNAIGNFLLDLVNFYRDFVGDTVPRALRILADEHVRQNFSVNNIRLNADVPYYAQLASNRSVGAANGNLRFVIGAVGVDVDLSGAPAGWNVLRIPIGQNNWPDRFAQIEDPLIEIIVSGMDSGFVLVDDVLFCPYDQADGSWYKLVGGRDPFIRDDSFSWTDVLGSGDEGLIQLYFFLAFGGPSFPSVTNGTEAFGDPNV